MSCATPAHRDPVVREHAHVVLQVVADLGAARVLEERAERAEHPLLVELIGRPGVAVGERNVRPFAGRDREGDPDDPRVDVVEARGLGVEGDEVRRPDALHPPVEGRLGQDRLVRRFGLGGGRRVVRAAATSSPSLRPLEKLAQQRAELEPAGRAPRGPAGPRDRGR